MSLLKVEGLAKAFGAIRRKCFWFVACIVDPDSAVVAARTGFLFWLASTALRA